MKKPWLDNRNPTAPPAPARPAIAERAGIGLWLMGISLVIGLWFVRAARADNSKIEAFSSTAAVASISVAPAGEVWAATSGGVLERRTDGSWIKFTTVDGLPSNEAIDIAAAATPVTATFPNAVARWDGVRWSADPAPVDPPGRAAQKSARWRGQAYTISDNQVIRSDSGTPVEGLPASIDLLTDIHADAEGIVVSSYSDGLWRYGGNKWTPIRLKWPSVAEPITAFALDGTRIWIGADGIWRGDGGVLSRDREADEPAASDIEALDSFEGALYASTLQSGLAVYCAQSWSTIAPPTLSSPAPRQMAVFQGALYVRNGDGTVDELRGASPRRNVFAALARHEVYAIATDGRRLYLGEWGGWSEFDGARLTTHLDADDLQGAPVTALLPDGDGLWIGTQRKGLFRFNRPTGALQHFDETDGLTDDWITCLEQSGKLVYAGTFVGGLDVFDGARWSAVAAVVSQHVSAVAPVAGGVAVATGDGVWLVSATGSSSRLNQQWPSLPEDDQCLAPDGDGGLWIGTRTGLYRLGQVVM